MKKIYIYTAAALSFLLASGILLGAARFADGFAEWYAQGPYQVLVAVFGRFFGMFPFSAAEVFLYAGAVALFCWLIRIIIAVGWPERRMEDGKAVNRKTYLIRQAVLALCIASVLLFSYTVGCGINYYRTSFATYSNLTIQDYSAEELAWVCRILTEELNAAAGEVTRDSSGAMLHGEDVQEGAVQAMIETAEESPSLQGYYPKPKKVLIPWTLSIQQITGIYAPFTFEANYNGDIPDYSVPFSACHELAHLRGYMQEEEANFIAWLACRQSERKDFWYSGSLRGWISCMNVLYRSDPVLWQEIRTQLHPLIEADLAANREYWAKYEGPVADAAQKMNDTYLKANGQSDGIRSYGRMTDLIVAWHLLGYTDKQA